MAKNVFYEFTLNILDGRTFLIFNETKTKKAVNKFIKYYYGKKKSYQFVGTHLHVGNDEFFFHINKIEDVVEI